MKHDVTAQEFLSSCSIDPSVGQLRPDYRALLIVAENLLAEPSTRAAEATEAMLVAAEEHAARLLAEEAVDRLPHIAAWREAYRAFGAKPQRTRNSLEALTRRAANGLPRVNALTDAYNAVSVLHQIPLGGEDLDRYQGPARLVVATGAEDFVTAADGEDVVDHPEPGEVVWCDDAGVTCRRWNWRQCRRTALTETTTRALFILDALGAMSDEELTAAGDALVDALRSLGGEATFSSRLVRP